MHGSKEVVQTAGKGLMKGIGKSLPAFGAGIFAYDLFNDWYTYKDKEGDLMIALGLTVLGAAVPIVISGVIIGFLAMPITGVAVGVVLGVGSSFVVPSLKKRMIGN